ncbi:CPBP family intramembrane metalloprotease [Listeria grandensis]|uniref:CPBP family intramembrane metalloprotease n=1 Tax=Listeria grandensis TaxID=1494963 RepID=A0A7X0Y710_9LIST|nr:CPBP family intramembrane glutamic endopeptidase [Listeria grandensis]MBC1475011.1 CPBP family intramembrane metalloprotease [Listeria grandensis]MBC1937577.1 CPBP family intramembrane metalloprotease [Listeria grandensis]
MENSLINRKNGYLIILIAILTGTLYQLSPHVITDSVAKGAIEILFNTTVMFATLYILLKSEFLDWFKHFSFKWLIIGIPFLLVVGTLMSSIWAMISGGTTANSVNSVLTWNYVITHVPFMLLGEELLSIGVLYAAWKKLGWKFWQASLLCAVLFALWHLPSYDYNLLQCLVTIIPSRLVLNYLFKKSNSIWVTWIVHITFDVITFLPILLN